MPFINIKIVMEGIANDLQCGGIRRGCNLAIQSSSLLAIAYLIPAMAQQ